MYAWVHVCVCGCMLVCGYVCELCRCVWSWVCDCTCGCVYHTETACVLYTSTVSWANVAKCANFQVVVHCRVWVRSDCKVKGDLQQLLSHVFTQNLAMSRGGSVPFKNIGCMF